MTAADQTAPPDPMTWHPPPPAVNPAAACITELCGPPAQSANFMKDLMRAWQDYAVAQRDPARSDYPPELKALLDQTDDASRQVEDIFAAKFKAGARNADQQLRGTARAVYALMQSQGLGEYIKMETRTADGKTTVVLNEAATRAALRALPPAEREWALTYAKTVPKMYDSPVSEDTVRSQPPAVTLFTLHPGVGVEQAARLEYARTAAALKDLRPSNPLERTLIFGEIKAERLRQIGAHVADGSATEDELRAMTLWNMSQRVTSWYVRDPASPLLKRETPPLDAIIAAAGGEDTLLTKFKQDARRDEARVAAQIRACHQQYFLNRRILPTEAQRKTLGQDVERAKADLRALVTQKFSGVERTKAIAAIDATKFILPPSVTSYEGSFRDVLTQRLDSARRGLADVRAMSPSDARQTVAVLGSIPTATDQASDPTGETNSICGAFNYQPLSDANYTANGSVLLSYVTARGPAEFRMGVITHELGHSVSKALREISPTMHGRTKCVDQFHGERPAILASVAGSTPEDKYVEEDFADELPSRARSAGSNKNWVCPLLALTYDQQAYSDQSLVSVNPQDDHSSTLFRLLHAEAARAGHLPESCDAFIVKSPVKPRFPDCLSNAASAEAAAGSAR